MQGREISSKVTRDSVRHTHGLALFSVELRCVDQF